MIAALRAGLLYFLGIFALGFLFGTVRTLWLAPVLSPLVAVFVELPFILAASWWLCGRLVRTVPATAGARLAMGAVALGLLLVAEAAVGLALMGRSWAEQLAAWGQPEALAGLVAQLAYAAFPLLRR